jgi:enamine deaminase RidA (YjgF/YER057c/UK114 family)
VEWASHAVRAGSFVFCSAFPASDFKSGLAVGKPAGFPNYGSNAEMQAEYVFTRMNRVLSQAGTSLEQAVESQLYEPDLLNFHDVDGIWAKYMPVPPPRSSMGVKGLILPGALCAPNLTILVPDKDLRKEESHKGLRWHPVKVRKVNFSPTMKVGPWRFFAGQVPSPDFKSALTVPAGLRHYRSDIEEQTRFTMQILTEQLEANETDWAHCHHVRLYLTEPRRDYRAFARVWREYFPDPARAPALAFVPSTGIMFEGPVIEIDPTCVVRG